MSRARHKEEHRATGGGVRSGSTKPDWNAGEEQNAAKEAFERKKGGKVEHMKGEGEHAKERHDRPKRAGGGTVIARAKGGAVPGRARGGGIGADRKPLSSAATVKAVTPGEQPESGQRD